MKKTKKQTGIENFHNKTHSINHKIDELYIILRYELIFLREKKYKLQEKNLSKGCC